MRGLQRIWPILLVAVGGGCNLPRPEADLTVGQPPVATEVTAPALRLATFNLQNFGPRKSTQPEVLSALAAIIRRFDVVAVQEISDASGQAPLRLLREINRSAPMYGLVLSERSGQQPDDRTSQEQYAFFYHTGTVQAQDQGILYPDHVRDDFQREPFMAAFVAKRDGTRFVLLTIHAAPGRTETEIPALAHVLRWARARFVGQDGFVILGDLNASGSFASAANLHRWRTVDLPYRWVVPDDADTNVSARTIRAYDRIILTDHLAGRYAGRWGIERAWTGETVSDHWPVWAEIR